MRLATRNVGRLQGRSREMVDMLGRRNVDICCLQEVRYRGQGTRMFGIKHKYKFWWSGRRESRNGVGIMVREELVEDVIEVIKIDLRLMKIKIVWGRRIAQIFSVNVPQQGRPDVEKQEFMEKLSDCIQEVSRSDIVMVAGDMNSHVGKRLDGFDDVMECFGLGERNQEEEEMLRLCQDHNMKVINTYLKKRREHLITYKSGDIEMQIDYIMYREKEEIKIKNCKAIPGEGCLTQHRLLCADLLVKEMRKKIWKRQGR